MEHKKHEIGALCALILTLLILFSFLSFHSSDLTVFNASTTQRAPQNLIGTLGAHISWIFLFLFGLGAYLLPILGFCLSWALFRGERLFPYGRVQFAGAGLLLVSSITLAALYQPKIHFFSQEILTGGELGLILAHFLSARLHMLGSHILLVGTFIIALLLTTPLTLRAAGEWLRAAGITTAGGLWRALCALGRLRPSSLRRAPREQEAPAPMPMPLPMERIRRVIPRVELLPPPLPEEEAVAEISSFQTIPIKTLKTAKPASRKKPEETPFCPASAASSPGLYALPPLDLLDPPPLKTNQIDGKKLLNNAATLEEKLADFSVQGKVMGISPGPVITMYEYAPAPGIKISRVVGLSDDLGMALKAVSIRVVAPIPGKAAIGIEIPNDDRELVTQREVLESEAFRTSPNALTIALGKDITGQSVVANLAKMPHLLIAGATGTGKSVCINAVLSSLLYRNTPDDLRLLLIDPKRIELSSYAGIPHLVHPVVTDAKMATRALRWAVQEMELRYKLLAAKNVRNIEGYNKALAREKPVDPPSPEAPPAAADAGESEALPPHHHLPYLVIIIDELADLMMVASKEVEESIIRLAQMARACGIHLILATQRPSVDVLTGIIKANVPTRISFQVSSRIDSRTILDSMGAESLLGSGDMLFLPPGTAKLQRIHGAFISDGEVQQLTEFWRSQQITDDPLQERVRFDEQTADAGTEEEELDEKYEEAVRVVMETRQASISMLQRRLRVGYNRAARMIEMMEQQGLVGPSDGVKPREVYRRG